MKVVVVHGHTNDVLSIVNVNECFEMYRFRIEFLKLDSLFACFFKSSIEHSKIDWKSGREF